MLSNIVVIIVSMIEICLGFIELRLIYLYFKKGHKDVIQFLESPYGLVLGLNVIVRAPFRLIDIKYVNEYLLFAHFILSTIMMIIAFIVLIIIVKAYRKKKIDDGILDADEAKEKERIQEKDNIWTFAIHRYFRTFISLLELYYCRQRKNNLSLFCLSFLINSKILSFVTFICRLSQSEVLNKKHAII